MIFILIIVDYFSYNIFYLKKIISHSINWYVHNWCSHKKRASKEYYNKLLLLISKNHNKLKIMVVWLVIIQCWLRIIKFFMLSYWHFNDLFMITKWTIDDIFITSYHTITTYMNHLWIYLNFVESSGPLVSQEFIFKCLYWFVYFSYFCW